MNDNSHVKKWIKLRAKQIITNVSLTRMDVRIKMKEKFCLCVLWK